MESRHAARKNGIVSRFLKAQVVVLAIPYNVRPHSLFGGALCTSIDGRYVAGSIPANRVNVRSAPPLLAIGEGE